MSHGPASLASVLGLTFLGSVSGGAFWTATFFVTDAHHGFSPARNLLLAAVMGAVYAVVARSTGPVLRRLPGISPRAVLAATLVVWGALALAPLLFPDAEAALWAAALTGAIASGIVWPIVESYLGAGRRGVELRSAVGAFNVTWTLATALPLVLMPLFAQVHVTWALSIAAVVNALAVPFCFALSPAPDQDDPGDGDVSVGREYPWLLTSASWLLPLSYVLSSTLSPILPHRLEETGTLGLPPSVVAATWMLTRFLTLGIMSRLHFWHGRWGALVLGGAALSSGLALVLLGTSGAAVVAGLALFGAGMGLTYYLALYYALAVGRGAVDAGGGFEALIGVGYFVGPLLGLAGRGLGGTRGAETTTLALSSFLAALATIAALGPYLEAKRRR